MTLGVGGATPFAMRSNHQTAYNHSFRDTSAYDPVKNNKIKCSFCGCWAKKGSICYLCKRPVGGGGVSIAPYPSLPPTPRPSMQVSQNRTPSSQSPAPAPDHAATQVGHNRTTARPSTAGSSSQPPRRVPDNALQHQFRETSAYDPATKLKVKCSFCGCWAHRGTNCYFCKTFNK